MTLRSCGQTTRWTSLLWSELTRTSKSLDRHDWIPLDCTLLAPPRASSAFCADMVSLQMGLTFEGPRSKGKSKSPPDLLPVANCLEIFAWTTWHELPSDESDRYEGRPSWALGITLVLAQASCAHLSPCCGAAGCWGPQRRRRE